MRDLKKANLSHSLKAASQGVLGHYVIVLVWGLLLAGVGSTFCQDRGKTSKETMRAASCAAQIVLSADLRKGFVSPAGAVSFRYVRGGIPGTNQAAVWNWTFVFYSVDAERAVIASATKDRSDVVHISPFIDTLKRDATQRWAGVDVGGGPGTAALTERFLDKLSINPALRLTMSQDAAKCIADEPE